MQQDQYIIRTTRVHVLPPGEPLFSELATLVSIEDQAGGEYLEVTQQSSRPDAKEQSITIEALEWPVLRGAIDMLIAECRDPDAPINHEPEDHHHHHGT